MGDVGRWVPPSAVRCLTGEALRVRDSYGLCSARTSQVASTTSRLLLVTSTEPGAARMARLVVFRFEAPDVDVHVLP